MKTSKLKWLMYCTILCGATAILTSCTTVKEYQKNKLNDSEMILSNRKIEKSELSFQSYR